MSLDQLNWGFNDALQTYYPPMGPLRRLVWRVASRLVAEQLRLRPRFFGGHVMVNERIVEYAMALRWLPERARVLDVGCVSSRFPLQLASLGYDVWGVDVRPYPIGHRNFHFVQHDLFDWNTDERFDVITAISTIEHFGIGPWGDRRDSSGDRVLLERLARLGRPGATLIASMPFGRPVVTDLHRVYGPEGLAQLFQGFAIRRKAFFHRDGLDWVPSNVEMAASQPSEELPVRAVVILEADLG